VPAVHAPVGPTPPLVFTRLMCVTLCSSCPGLLFSGVAVSSSHGIVPSFGTRVATVATVIDPSSARQRGPA
jgi:hypothetical protein